MVFGYRMVDYAYFMDKLQPWEVDTLIEAIPYADRPTWEQTRIKVFSTAAMFSKNQLTVKDIMRFAWDIDEETPDIEVTQSDIERLRQQAKIIETTVLKNGRL